MITYTVTCAEACVSKHCIVHAKFKYIFHRPQTFFSFGRDVNFFDISNSNNLNESNLVMK